MILVTLCALGAACGVGLLGWSLLPHRRSLAAEVDGLLAPPAPAATAGDGDGVGFLATVGASLWSAAGGSDPQRFSALRRDLAAAATAPAVYAGQCLLAAAVFAALAWGLVAVLAAGGLALPAAAAVLAGLLAGAAGGCTPRLTVRSQALERRAEMAETVAVVCDLCAVLVAGGDDVDGAFAKAARVGRGWAFDQLRAALSQAGSRRSTWSVLEALGESLGVDALVVMAQNMGLAEEKGAKVRDALRTQAKTLRAEAASEVEAKAGSATERMSFPMVLLLIGFLLVIGYPAMVRL